MTVVSPAVEPSLIACLAAGYLRDRPRRWQRTRAVVSRADALACRTGVAGPGRDALMCAAWLVEIGSAHPASATGWQVLDGARLARGWSLDDVAGLLAWRSAAPEEAVLRGLVPDQSAFPRPYGPAALALTAADLLTGPGGETVTLSGALVGARARHGQDSVQARALEVAWSRLSPIVSALG